MFQVLHDFLGKSNLFAYLVLKGIRLFELHRVLKPTASIFLHCDPTASHYLKILMNALFDIKNFVNEIIWKRQAAHSDTTQGSKHFGRLHDYFFMPRTNESKLGINHTSLNVLYWSQIMII